MGGWLVSVVELRFYAWNAPNGSLLGTLTDEDLEAFEIRPEFRGAEAGFFSIPRSHPSATTTLLGFGIDSLAGPRLVKVHFPWMPAPYDTDPAFAFWLWEGDFKLLNQDGDDLLSFSGPGVRGIWSEYVLYHSSTVSDQPWRGSQHDTPGIWWWENQPYGAIATRIFEEGRHNPYPGAAAADSTFEHVTIDFDRVTDSDGQTWSTIAEEYEFRIRTDAGTILADLEEAGDFTLVGTPNLLFSAYESYGTDRTGTAYGAGVVRVQGDTGTSADNVLTDLSRHAFLNRQRTHILGEDKDGAYHTETHPDYVSGPERWGSLESPETNDDTLLNKKSAQAFLNQDRDQNQIEVEIKPGNDEANGRYLPWVHFIPGDTITVDTGSGSTDYNNTDALLTAFRVSLAEAADDTDDDTAARSLHVVLELNTRRVNAGVPLASPNSGSSGIGHTHPLPLCRPGVEASSSTTRLYFSSDVQGISPLTSDAAWADGGSTTVRTLKTAPDDTYDGTGSGQSLFDGTYAVSNRLSTALYAIQITDADQLAAIQAGGITMKGQIRARSRSGIGIDEDAQDNIAQWVARIYRSGTGFIGTMLAAHSSASGTKFPAQTTFVNRSWTGTSSAVASAALNDYLVVEVGCRHLGPTDKTGGASINLASIVGGDDLPEDESTSTNLNSWIEFRSGGDTLSSVGDGHPDLIGTSMRAKRCDDTEHFFSDRTPTVNDDFATAGMRLGTHWVYVDDVDDPTESFGSWMLVDASEGAAVWVQISSGTSVGAHTHTADDITDLPTPISTVVDHSTMGATEEFDFTDGSDHEGTQDTDLTVTLTGATDGEAAFLTLVLAQDGTGGHSLTLPAEVVTSAEVEAAWDQTANAVNILNLFSYDGGGTWYAFLAGGSGALSDDTPLAASGAGDPGVSTEASRSDHVHPASSSGPPSILLESGHATPFTFDEILQESDGSDFLWASE